ncbi:hypothetical protein [Nocardia sp. XZ_19_385]|uniref:hypothetical protein n=1 Tax=Nocardia sp. XZ_19_385 TaxID=2769488 RepID=UPI00188F52B6|nr:hypothetical protein [Nocardia sp. XZ_19_385]
MAFTVHTSEDASPAGLEFGDNDSFTIYSSGVLKVRSETYGNRIYSPGFWQLVEYRNHSEHGCSIYGVDA